MRHVAEIMYIVEPERETFLEGALHPDSETTQVLYSCGVRNQVYFSMNELVFMTFEYVGDSFTEDMRRMSAFLDSKGKLIKNRRRDVPLEARDKVSWWAPVKRLGAVLEGNAYFNAFYEDAADLNAMLDGCMDTTDEYDYQDLSFDEDDWSDGIRI